VIGPYVYIRTVTLSLGVLWSSFTIVRVLRSANEWQTKLVELGLGERWWRRRFAVACLRATVLDPLNLLLLWVLIALWTLPLPH